MKKNNLLHLIVLGIILAVLLSACGSDAPTDFTVMEWSGYELEQFWAPYAEAYPDNPPAYSFFADDAEALAKAQSGFGFDVSHPCSSWWGLYVEQGLVQPIDISRLTNFADLYPSLASQGVFNGKQYFIPYDWGYESILVRSDLVDQVPDSWTDLWDPQYAGHVSIFDSSETAFLTTAVALGIDPYNTTPADNEAIKQKLIDLKPNLLNFWTDFTEINQLVAQGDVWVAANTWNDAYAALSEEGYAVEYLTPVEGRFGWLCGYGISADADNLDQAYAYLNALISPDAQSSMGNEFYYGVSSQAAAALLDPYIVELMDLDNPVVLEQTRFYQTLTQEQRQTWEQVFLEVKATK